MTLFHTSDTQIFYCLFCAWWRPFCGVGNVRLFWLRTLCGSHKLAYIELVLTWYNFVIFKRLYYGFCVIGKKTIAGDPSNNFLSNFYQLLSFRGRDDRYTSCPKHLMMFTTTMPRKHAFKFQSERRCVCSGTTPWVVLVARPVLGNSARASRSGEATGTGRAPSALSYPRGAVTSLIGLLPHCPG